MSSVFWPAIGAVGVGVLVAIVITLLLWPKDIIPDALWPNDEITHAIRSLLAEHDEIDSGGVLLRVTGGEVLLLGSVVSTPAKYQVETLVATVVGVVSVNNQLWVDREVRRPRKGGSAA